MDARKLVLWIRVCKYGYSGVGGRHCGMKFDPWTVWMTLF
jgi:hypothetical protein